MIDSLSSLSSLGADATSGVQGARTAGAGFAAGTESRDFAEVLAEVADKTVETLRAGESTAIAGLKGSASVQQVVEAVMSAEQSLQAAIAIRDKVVSAYQEITRMVI